MIYAQPDTNATAILSGAPGGLVGTLTVQIERADGSTHTAATTAGIVEVEAGIYAAALTAPTDQGTYVVVWNNGGTRTAEELFVTYTLPTAVPPGPALVSLDRYKRAIGETSSANDQKHQEALDDASAAVAAYTDRDLGAPLATADRTYFYDGSGFLEIDDAASINSVRFDTQTAALETTAWEAFRDGPAGVPFSYLVLSGPYRMSGEMGFTRNLDQETRVVVNASWGWATVPNDIQRAVIWTAGAYEAMADTAGGTISSQSVAEVSRSYTFNAAAPNPDATSDIPGRAKVILDQYRRHIL